MGYDENGLFSLSEGELVNAFSNAYARVWKRDRFLFMESNPQERTFMFRFAQELRNEFLAAETPDGENPMLSLDVEYNRDGTNVKYEDPNHPRKRKWIAPDIILHERGSGSCLGEDHNRNNIFVCEMKKDAPWENMTSDEKEKQKKRDADTVQKFIAERKYQYGVDFCQFVADPARFDLYAPGKKKKVYKFNCHTNKFETKGSKQ